MEMPSPRNGLFSWFLSPSKVESNRKLQKQQYLTSSLKQISQIKDPKQKYHFLHFQLIYQQFDCFLVKTDVPIPLSKVQTKGLIESLRLLSEFLLYSDQNMLRDGKDCELGRFFDYFCEQNTLLLFLQMLECIDSTKLEIQLLQTVSILLQNITSMTSLYYLLSNNYINMLIRYSKFRFGEDEEILHWYITLLKAFSIRMDCTTIQFFFNAAQKTFPLYTTSLQYLQHSEMMIRISIRTLTLNIFRVPDASMRAFICNQENPDSVKYFVDTLAIGATMTSNMQGCALDKMLQEDKFSCQLNEYMDYYYYLQDVFDIGIPKMSLQLGDIVFTELVYAILIQSLLPSCSINRSSRHGVPTMRISAAVSMYLLTHFYICISHKPLLNAVTYVLLHPENDVECVYEDAMAASKPAGDEASKIRFTPHDVQKCANSSACFYRQKYAFGDWAKFVQNGSVDTLKKGGNVFRSAILLLLNSKNEALEIGAMTLLCAIRLNEQIDDTILYSSSLKPRRRHRRKSLLQGTESDSSTSKAHIPEYWQECMNVLLHRLEESPSIRIVNIKVALRLMLLLVYDVDGNYPILTDEHEAKCQAMLTTSVESIANSTCRDKPSNFMRILLQETFLLENAKFPLEIPHLASEASLFFGVHQTTTCATKNSVEESEIVQFEQLQLLIQRFWHLRKLGMHVFSPELVELEVEHFENVLQLCAIDTIPSHINLEEAKHQVLPCTINQGKSFVVLHDELFLITDIAGQVTFAIHLALVMRYRGFANPNSVHVNVADGLRSPLNDRQLSPTTISFANEDHCKSLVNHIDSKQELFASENMQTVQNWLDLYTTT